MEGVCSEKLNPDPIRTALGNASPYHWHIDSICTADQLYAVFCPGLKKGMVLLEEKGHFCSRNYILRALSRA